MTNRKLRSNFRADNLRPAPRPAVPSSGGPGLLSSTPEPPMRRHYPCEADRPICPSCHKPIRRVTVIGGHFLAQCDSGPSSARCGQHMHITAADGLCWVVELTKDEATALRDHVGGLSAREVYRSLGLLTIHEHRRRGDGEANQAPMRAARMPGASRARPVPGARGAA